jgi:hypothetical protein
MPPSAAKWKATPLSRWGPLAGVANLWRSSGYSAHCGAAQLLGFHFMVNFRQPYLATSLQDFWRRWHISLSTWLRDYLYIPLGGSRNGETQTYRNLMTTMLLGGLWHGANWTFVFWGAIHGIGLSIGAHSEIVQISPSTTAGSVLRPSGWLAFPFYSLSRLDILPRHSLPMQFGTGVCG